MHSRGEKSFESEKTSERQKALCCRKPESFVYPRCLANMVPIDCVHTGLSTALIEVSLGYGVLSLSARDKDVPILKAFFSSIVLAPGIKRRQFSRAGYQNLSKLDILLDQVVAPSSIIVDYSIDYSVVNGVWYFFQIFSL